MSKKKNRNKKKKVQLKVNESVVMGTVSTNTRIPLDSTIGTTVPHWTASPTGKVNVIAKYEAKKIDWFKVFVAIIIVADVLMLLWYALK